MKKFRFTGRIERINNSIWSRTVNLYESKKFWYAEDGTIYHKQTGKRYGKDNNNERLDLTSIVERDQLR